jgi:LuxR family transcriptional regulator, maltose regulon positive regulatory protein
VAYQQNELGAAQENVARGITLCRSFVYTMPLAAGLATQAWIRQAEGDPAGALEAMDEAMQASPGPPGLLNPIPARWAQLLLAQGNLSGAVRWTEEAHLDPGDEPAYAREPGHLVLARVLLAQQRAGPALALLDRLHAAAVAQDRVGSLIEIGALRALALAAHGETDDAVNTLASTLIAACPPGYVRLFADEGQPMATLLGRLIAARKSGEAATELPLDCLARLQHALHPHDAVPATGNRSVPVIPGLIEQLTSRELEVLQMVAAGSSNQAIASHLVVTVDTVKKHVSHILSKLGATNRTEAVARARELGLIP